MKPAFVFTLLLIQSTLWAQDLETPWRDFLSVDARLMAANELERGWLEQQHKLSEEIRGLQQSQSWYNGWIIELLLARKSALQVGLADSLQQIRKKIAALEVQQNKAFLALREVYQRILFESESEDRLSLSQKEQAITIGRRLMSQNDATFNLPDYSSILNNPYDNEAVKRLVLNDLQSVLQAKLVLIDSLLTEKETELVLLSRLNEFHRDLSYQMQSNLDLEPEDAQGSPESGTFGGEEYSTFGGEEYNNDASWITMLDDEEGRASELKGSDRSMATPLDQTRGVSGETDIQLNVDPIDEVIGRLKTKRQQYQDLLRQIETELPH